MQGHRAAESAGFLLSLDQKSLCGGTVVVNKETNPIQKLHGQDKNTDQNDRHLEDLLLLAQSVSQSLVS